MEESLFYLSIFLAYLVFISWNKSSSSENLQVAEERNSFITGRKRSPAMLEGCDLWNSTSLSTCFSPSRSAAMSFSSSPRLEKQRKVTQTCNYKGWNKWKNKNKLKFSVPTLWLFYCKNKRHRIRQNTDCHSNQSTKGDFTVITAWVSNETSTENS